MKKFFTTALVALLPLMMMAQGWPSRYDGVMLQGFYWDSFKATRWDSFTSFNGFPSLSNFPEISTSFL